LCALIGNICAGLENICADIGDICAVLGNIYAVLGNICADIGDICADLGNICADLDNICALLGNICADIAPGGLAIKGICMEIEEKRMARKTVLAVDDIMPSLEIIKKALEDEFDVCLAKSTDMASVILTTNKVDLILLDIAMPEMSGFEFLKSLRRFPQYRAIPVIFVTSHAQKNTLTRAMVAGVRDFIVKPFSPVLLAEKVRAVFGPAEKAAP
jgi:CheY-like chemotaxis protein